jgi:hypothetical protein
MVERDQHRLDRLARRNQTLLIAIAIVAPFASAAFALALASGMLVEPGFATAVAVTALLLLLG